MCSTIDSGEKGYKLLEQILFNFLVLFPTLDCDSAYDGDTDLPQVKRSKIKRKSAVRGKIQECTKSDQ